LGSGRKLNELKREIAYNNKHQKNEKNKNKKLPTPLGIVYKWLIYVY
jgi:hypothetical protein